MTGVQTCALPICFPVTIYLSLSFADIQGGPFVHIGQDFFGKGIIDHIEKIDSGKEGYIILKITLRKNKTKEKK